MSPDRIAHRTNQALRFITPVPFCSYKLLSHCATLNRTDNALRDPLFDNISAVLSTAYMLQRRCAVDTNQVHNLQQEIVRICSDELVPVNNLISAPSPLHHFVEAANMFRRITGCTPDMYIQQLGSRQPLGGKLHRLFYAFMLERAAPSTHSQLEQRVVSTGINWEPLKANLVKLPSCIPRGFCITFFKYLLNGLLTSSRRRFSSDVVVANCPFCGQDASDDRRHWVLCPVIQNICADLYGGLTSMNISHDHFHLQVPLDGRELQLLLAFIHAI